MKTKKNKKQLHPTEKFDLIFFIIIFCMSIAIFSLGYKNQQLIKQLNEMQTVSTVKINK